MKLFGSATDNDVGALLADGDKAQMTPDERIMNGIGNVVEVRRKPPGVPPVPDMILEALREAKDAGKPGLNPQAMVQFVRSKYWKEAGNPDIGSTAWRMWKDGRLAKPDENSSLYMIAPAKEVAA